LVKVVNSSGKRKTAIAKASVKKGEGRVRINRIPLELHDPELARKKIMEPLIIAGKQDRHSQRDSRVPRGRGAGKDIQAIRQKLDGERPEKEDAEEAAGQGRKKEEAEVIQVIK
jgi:small subunit ribosomal protein S9